MQRDVTWSELLNRDLPREATDPIRLYRVLLESLDTPVSLGCYLRLKYNGLKSALSVVVDPRDYIDRNKYFDDVQAVKFLSKWSPGADPSLRQSALQTLERGEHGCEIENQFWGAYEGGHLSLTPNMEALAFKVRDIVETTLGSFCVEEWLDSCRFGPGTVAFSEVPKPSDADKLMMNPGVTPEFAPYARSFLRNFAGWYHHLTYEGVIPLSLKVIQGGKYTTVPKSALTDRNIETQPSLNIFAQLGLGGMIRRRLRERLGIDLIYGQAKNRNMARIGSITGEYATIDLSNASDSIAIGLVRQVLPADWFKALTLVRTSSILVGDEWRILQRFSAMGNGYTFELETLLFFAIARAAAPKGRITVYGDDIIVPTKYYQEVLSALRAFGFTPNPRKSFGDGLFRESCGADWFDGHPVRPFYLDETPSRISDVVSLCNGLLRVAHRRSLGYGFDRKFRGVWTASLRCVPPVVRRRLATGITADDRFLLHWRFKGDRCIVARTEQRFVTSWHTAVSTALYRAYVREQSRGIQHGEDLQTSGQGAKCVISTPGRSRYAFQPINPGLLFRTWGGEVSHDIFTSVPWAGWVTS